MVSKSQQNTTHHGFFSGEIHGDSEPSDFLNYVETDYSHAITKAEFNLKSSKKPSVQKHHQGLTQT